MKKKTNNMKNLTKSARDYSKYTFKGEKYGKGHLVLAVVSDYVKEHPDVTLDTLQNLFPRKELHSGFEIAQNVNKANKGRFFLNLEDIIKVGNKDVAVNSQWGKDNIQDFIVCARKKLHIKIYTHRLSA